MCVMWPEVWLCSAGFLFFFFFFTLYGLFGAKQRHFPVDCNFYDSSSFFPFLFSRMSLSVPPAWFPPGYLPLYWTAKPTLIVFSANVFRREPVNKLLINEKRQSFTGTLFVLLHFTLWSVRAVKWKSSPGAAALEHFVMSQRVLTPRPAARCQFSPWRQMEGMSEGLCFFLNWEFLLEAVNKTKINPVDLKIVVWWYFSKGAQAHTGSEYKYLPFLEG